MKKVVISLSVVLVAAVLFAACSSANKLDLGNEVLEEKVLPLEHYNFYITNRLLNEEMTVYTYPEGVETQSYVVKTFREFDEDDRVSKYSYYKDDVLQYSYTLQYGDKSIVQTQTQYYPDAYTTKNTLEYEDEALTILLSEKTEYLDEERKGYAGRIVYTRENGRLIKTEKYTTNPYYGLEDYLTYEEDIEYTDSDYSTTAKYTVKEWDSYSKYYNYTGSFILYTYLEKDKIRYLTQENRNYKNYYKYNSDGVLVAIDRKYLSGETVEAWRYKYDNNTYTEYHYYANSKGKLASKNVTKRVIKDAHSYTSTDDCSSPFPVE